MQEIDEQIVMLLHKSIAGEELEEEEIATLGKWLAASPHHPALVEELMDESRLEKEVKALMAIDEDAALKTLQQKIVREKKKENWFANARTRYAAAAMLLLGIGAGIYALYRIMGSRPNPEEDGTARSHYKNDVPPGYNNARLTLADGSTLVLDSSASGVLVSQPGSTIHKEPGYRLVYESSHTISGPGETPVYNTVTTPRRSQSRIVLPDGSAVWLNAESSLRFPTSFAGRERKVMLHGEAYFEVKPQEGTPGLKTPFTVVVMNADREQGRVQVLGTRFNINAYPDEVSINTTLLEGKVSLQTTGKDQSSVSLQPGDEARLAPNGAVQVSKPDTEKAISWKDGFFHFKDMDIETIMRMVSRWYDVRVLYKGKITQTFTGKIERALPVSQLLERLELTKEVFFTIDGNTITVKSQPS